MSVPIRHYSPEPKRRQNREEKIPKPAFHGQSVQTVFGPCHSDRQTSQVSHLHHCVLANLKVYHYRPFPSSRLSTTDRLYPGFPARLLRCYLFHSTGRKKFCHSCRSVTAPRLRLMKRLTYLNCWIWLAGYGVIPSCARSPAFLSGIFQCAFCLPVSYPHTRHERIPGRDHLSRKSSSHKVLTEKHVLRGY